MKPTTLVYCGEDCEAGKALAVSLRDGSNTVLLCAASAFQGRAEMPCDRVVFTDDVKQRLRAAISAAHGLQLPELISEPVRKRGWPKGKPRKAA